ncbi:M48 family metalloprotease [Bacteroides sp.]
MKRILFSLTVILLSYGIAFTQSTPLSPVLNIKGVFKTDYQNITKGTPFVLQRVVKLKTIPENGDSDIQIAVIVNGGQLGVPANQLDIVEMHPDTKDAFWQVAQLSKDLISYYSRKGYQKELRQEQAEESDEYLKELAQSQLFYEDAATEDYLQCLLLSIAPSHPNMRKTIIPQVHILKSPSPDALMLSNHCLLISTGLLSTLDTEEELYAILAREVAHEVLDHAIITTNKNTTRAKRAEFWGAIANGAVTATEEILYQRYYNYEPGIFFATNDIIQTLVNEKIMNRMGLDYSEKQEYEADEYAMRFMEFSGKNKEALISALTKIYSYYMDKDETKVLSKGDIYGSLEKRLKKMGTFTPLAKDRNYLKTMSAVVSFESGMMDYNNKYVASGRLAMKNIKNNMACPNDYIMMANSVMKLSNTPESNQECMLYLDKAEELSKNPNLNVCKLRILLSLRENNQTTTLKLLQNYKDLLINAIQDSRSSQEEQWLAAEQVWAEKLTHRILF